MILLYQIGAAVLLVSLTLLLQVSGVTGLIEWLKRVLARDVDKHGPTYSATLVMESTVAIVFLHGLAILLWAAFYRCALLPILGNRLLLLSQQLFHCRLRRRGSPVDLATLRPFGRRHWRVDVRNINKCSFCPRHPAARPRHTVLGWKEADGQSIACRSWRIDEFGGTKPCLKPISRLPMSVMR